MFWQGYPYSDATMSAMASQITGVSIAIWRHSSLLTLYQIKLNVVLFTLRTELSPMWYTEGYQRILLNFLSTKKVYFRSVHIQVLVWVTNSSLKLRYEPQINPIFMWELLHMLPVLIYSWYVLYRLYTALKGLSLIYWNRKFNKRQQFYGNPNDLINYPCLGSCILNKY